MKNIKEIKKIYRAALDLLEKGAKSHEEIISGCALSLGLSENEISDTATGSRAERIRSVTGSVINEMLARGIIAKEADGRYLKLIENK